MAGDTIELNEKEPGSYEVRVVSGTQETTHIVEVPGDLSAAGLPESHPEELVEASFRFLLDREPNTAILDEFSLTDIKRYFPEYPEAVRRYFGG